ncbi:uncharacterized protein XM38_046250 [Halomicronema hongdechloris C2206]|uniref:Pyruvate/2-oxoglutarate dehydrogenase complex,dihydrolipoamide dehydrogenase (E3) component n=1 Tax=Halomicronema hongdechloris C2206 TaxID=1641165 RepID=A0A1Z3HTM1_9CYAN|nr:DUF4330 domain-containing protein [Halomicronema hongdechloris]ASC73653.1 uncharacterized protein XM38_046250 [Halomicronema hongdechloris C2206]
MTILDAQGRLFGRISLLDIGAALIILMVIVGVFFYPGAGGSVAQMGIDTKPIEVDVMVRGLTVSNPDDLYETLSTAESTNIIIRNQPYGQVGIQSVERLPRSTAVPQPDGSVESFPDPRPELNYTIDMLITLTGDAQMTDNGPVFGNNKVKIGTQIELEGELYDFYTSVVGVRILEE